LGFVYCISNNNKIKIGRTIDFLKRFNSYKSHIGEYPTVLKLELVLKHTEFEQLLISKLQTLGHTNEWFDKTHKDLILSCFK
ncbi:GIY-YIG nuclease family protein, partial [Arthrospira platensis SPKY1]|nr:GIY-YIG nuclease family protein [Arthrospira platensis SPKY1]